MAHVGDKEILGETVEIHADQYGSWRIMLPPPEGEEGRSEAIGSSDKSLDAAMNAARAELNKRRVKVEVNFITKSGKPGTATHIDHRSRSVIARVGDAPAKLSPHEKSFKPDIPFDVLRDYLARAEEMQELARQQRAVEKEWETTVYADVKHEIDQKVNERKALAGLKR
jgi:hypothetical protein